MAKVRVLVVEDSLTTRKYLVEVLSADPELEVVGEAADGKQAIELCESLRPDVISMDMMLPFISGLAATEYIMAYCPTPILIVSASTNRGELLKTYDALSAGAVDVLEKPTAIPRSREWEAVYRKTIKLVSRIKVITHPRGRVAGRPLNPPDVFTITPARGAKFRVVAIGASTGGPAAVSRVLQGLPADFPLPILVVIHINSPFGIALTEWLGSVSPIPVRSAVDGEPCPKPGQPQVILAPPDRHLAVREGRLWTTSEPERHHCRPSVDVLFESAAACLGSAVTACLLTGMGQDGARGLLAVRQAGGMTIAQDEQSCVIFGMPREAIRLDAARQVLPLDQIAPALRSLAKASALKPNVPVER